MQPETNPGGPAVRVAPPEPRREARPIDAVILPRGFVGPGRAREQHARANDLFAGLAGVRGFWWITHESFSFGVPNTGFANYARDLDGASLLFGSGHPLAGQPRFEWFLAERGDDGRIRPAGLCPDGHLDAPGVPKLGYRRADPAAGDPAVILTAAEHRSRQAETYKLLLKAALSTPETYDELRDRLGASDAEMEALFGHVDRIVA